MTVFRYLVGDLDAAIAFYTGNLGFTLEQQKGPAFAIVSRDDLSLWLSGPQPKRPSARGTAGVERTGVPPPDASPPQLLGPTS